MLSKPAIAASFLVLIVTAGVRAEPIAIPNYSFELPPVDRNGNNPFGALPYIDSWDENDPGLLDELNQNTGVFLNTADGEPDHIVNADQLRLAFISTLIGNAVRQELDAVYEVDAAYTFTIAVGTSYTFPAGAAEELDVALYYLDGDNEIIIASTTVTGAQVEPTSVFDFSVSIPPVQAGDPWAGSQIGLLVQPSPTDPDDTVDEGFWNLDNARLDRVVSTCTGDLDGDGHVDLFDIALVLDGSFGSLDNPQPERAGSSCTGDLDGDGDVDLDDIILILNQFTGPN